MKKLAFAFFLLTVIVAVFGFKKSPAGIANIKISDGDTILYPEEKHFKNARQLTFGGDNAEAYFSFDGKWLVFQKSSAKEGIPCDQMFIGKVPTTSDEKFEPKLISSGKGRTTCGFFTKDNKHVIYASTHLGGDACPPVPDRSKYGNKYIWPVYASYDIFMADLDGKIVKQLTNSDGYDAEATLSPDGNTMLFTSMRDGDLELYTMNLKTGKTKRITNALGYDGGAWFSPDGKKIVWRASRPKSTEEIEEYKSLLKDNMVAPTRMEVWIANKDGSEAKQITNLGQANWAPNFLPNGNIIFCSNHEYKRGFPFNMYTINTDGSGLEKISRDKGFDAFPMFSPDKKTLVFSSNRNNGGTRDTNLFLVEWID